MPIVGVPAVITAIYESNAGQYIASGIYVIVNFEDKVKDTHNAVTTGVGWKFTAPQSGLYQVVTSIMFARTTTWAITEPGKLFVYVNGIPYAALNFQYGSGEDLDLFKFLEGTILLYLDVTDELNVRVQQISGGTLPLYAVATYNRVAIAKYPGG